MRVNKWYDGWDFPSTQLAYFLGVLCSDGCVTKYTFEITVAEKDRTWLNTIRTLIDGLFGVPVTIGEIKVVNRGVYPRLWTCSKLFKENIDLRGEGGEWAGRLVKKFKWVQEDVFFWQFLSGLFDGDGSLCVHKKRGGSINYPIASIAIHPSETRLWVKKMLSEKGFEAAYDGSCSLEIRGGKRKTYEFIGKLSCCLKRKQLGNLFK